VKLLREILGMAMLLDSVFRALNIDDWDTSPGENVYDY